MNILSPSLLAVDFCNIEKNVKALDKAGAKWLHLDVMDGVFVPNISFGPPVIESIRKITDMFFDVHLMVTEPIRYVDVFKKAGADMLTIHYEACEDIKTAIEKIKSYGMKAGIAIKPQTDVLSVKKYIPMVDMTLVMSVEPGFGGQKFMASSIEKIKEVKSLADKYNPDMYIQIDGGINFDNVKGVTDAGCNVVVAGSAVFKGDVGQNIERFGRIIG